ncbi:MAG TPA: alpha/beta hydrolase [Casimicrobiaceae bacterium]|nr:alpha/beta hydrolase [Casimicrobiaceae bacterium]
MTELLIAAAVLAAGVCALAWWAQERLIFFPQPLESIAHLPARTVALDVTAADGTRLAGFFVPSAAAPAPVIIYFGGNAEEASWTLADARWPHDYALATFNYRGYGKSGGEPGEQALTQDALAIYDAIARRRDVDAKRIVVHGRSLGTAVAVHVAAARPVAGVILVSPFDSLVAVGRKHYPWLPVSLLLRHRFDAASLARGIHAPMLALVGDADTIVSPARSRALFDAWAGPKTWQVITGANHNDLGASAVFWDSIAAFLRAPA